MSSSPPLVRSTFISSSSPRSLTIVPLHFAFPPLLLLPSLRLRFPSTLAPTAFTRLCPPARTEPRRGAVFCQRAQVLRSRASLRAVHRRRWKMKRCSLSAPNLRSLALSPAHPATPSSASGTPRAAAACAASNRVRFLFLSKALESSWRLSWQLLSLPLARATPSSPFLLPQKN